MVRINSASLAGNIRLFLLRIVHFPYLPKRQFPTDLHGLALWNDALKSRETQKQAWAGSSAETLSKLSFVLKGTADAIH